MVAQRLGVAAALMAVVALCGLWHALQQPAPVRTVVARL